jgi:hypothetical protein
MIMVLPIIGKNLMVSAYIQAGARVPCKVPRTALTLALVFAELELATVVPAPRSVEALLFPARAFVTQGVWARVPRR